MSVTNGVVVVLFTVAFLFMLFVGALVVKFIKEDKKERGQRGQ